MDQPLDYDGRICGQRFTPPSRTRQVEIICSPPPAYRRRLTGERAYERVHHSAVSVRISGGRYGHQYPTCYGPDFAGFEWEPPAYAKRAVLRACAVLWNEV